VHSPISGIKVAKPEVGESVDDLRLYRMVAESQGRLAAFLKGPPGSGKSHLIRWLSTHWTQQRKDYDHVLFISRDDGSLKATLRRLVESLGTDKDLVANLSDAGENLSPEGVAAELLYRLAFNLNPAHRKRPLEDVRRASPLELWKIFDYPRVKEELQRPGGPIKLAIDKLVGDKGKLAEALPRFEPGELDELARRCAGIQGISARLNRIADDPTAKALAVPALNAALAVAVQESAAIDPQALPEALRELRRRVHLRTPGKRIVLLIEDVSAFTGIDQSLIEALLGERNASEDGLAPLLAVVGLTTQYFENAFDGKDAAVQRMTHIFSIEGGASIEGDPVAFAARYLNAVRFGDPTQIDDWAGRGAVGSAPSACSDCPSRKSCHQDFGAWEGYGLYPFNAKTLPSAYRGLKDPSVPSLAAQRTPRTFKWLLGNLLNEDAEDGAAALRALRDKQEPERSPAIKPRTRQIARARDPERAEELVTLARWWGDETFDAGEDGTGRPVAGGIAETVFTHFGLPFTRTGEAPPPPVVPPISPEDPPPPEKPQRGDDPVDPRPPPPPPPPPPPDRLAETLERLRRWHEEGDSIERDTWQPFAYTLLRYASPWHEFGLPDSDDRLFAATAVAFERQRGQTLPGALILSPAIDVYDALTAVAHAEARVADEDGLQARDLFRFAVRRGPLAAANTAAQVPKLGGGRWDPALGALQLLILEAIFSRRAALNDRLPKLLQAVFTDGPTNPHRTLGEWSDLARRLSDKREELRNVARTWLDLAERGVPFLDISSRLPLLKLFLANPEPDAAPADAAFRAIPGGRAIHLLPLANLLRETRETLLPDALKEASTRAKSIATALAPNDLPADMGPAQIVKLAERLSSSIGLKTLGSAPIQPHIEKLRRSLDQLTRSGADLEAWTADRGKQEAAGFAAAAQGAELAPSLERLAALDFDGATPVSEATNAAGALIRAVSARRQELGGNGAPDDTAALALEKGKKAVAELTKLGKAIKGSLE
jgi:hypothetical protein